MNETRNNILNESASPLPTALYTAEQCRALDRVAIEQFAIPGIHLMKLAGRAAFEKIFSYWQRSARANRSVITVFCGSGNNAGDGYVVAGLARQRRLPVVVKQVGDVQKLKGDAALAYQFALDSGVEIGSFDSNEPIAPGIVVDALLGTGIQGSVRGEYVQAIAAINASGQPVFAIDLPSGLCADSGRILGAAVHAGATITFIGLKRGLFTGQGPNCVGELFFDDLNLPAAVYGQVPIACEKLELTTCLAQLKFRPSAAHKGDFGHVLVVGGDHGMGGAVAMAAEAAARVGAGLVSVATHAANVSAIVTRRPEIMAKAVEDLNQLQSLLERATVVVLGSGLGQSEWSRRLFSAVLNADLPMVVDADGLNLLAKGASTSNHRWVLTPHPGEAGRLLACETAVINNDRFFAVENLQSRYGGVAVLKGAGTLIAAPDDSQRLSLCAAGNPGMASGGMGDVLSGVIGGLIAQGMSLAAAAKLGVSLHATAADKAIEHVGPRGLLATDLMPHLRRLVNG